MNFLSSSKMELFTNEKEDGKQKEVESNKDDVDNDDDDDDDKLYPLRFSEVV
jgi:hypothetical protein